MNDQLRKSMNVRNHFRQKWERVDSKENRAIYVKHRNSTMRLRKQSMLRIVLIQLIVVVNNIGLF